MVSNASVDLPEPLTPVMTISWPVGRVRSRLRRLFWRAPRTTMPCEDDLSVLLAAVMKDPARLRLKRLGSKGGYCSHDCNNIQYGKAGAIPAYLPLHGIFTVTHCELKHLMPEFSHISGFISHNSF